MAVSPGVEDHLIGVTGKCQTCPLPADVWRLGTRMLVLERDITATIASIQAVEERLSTLTRILGEEVGRLAGCVGEIHHAVKDAATHRGDA